MEYHDFDQLLVLSVEQLANVLNLGKNSTYDLVRSGRIKSTRIGNQFRITKFAIKEFLSA